MSIQVGVGIGVNDDSYVAGLNACQNAIQNAGGDPHFVLAFSSSEYDQEKVNAGIRSVAGTAVVIGTTTAGEITTDGPAQKHSVVAMAIKSDTMRFYGGVGENIHESPFNAGKALADSIKQQAGSDPLKAFIMLPDILAGNGAETVRGVLSSLGEHFPVVGGASGDDFKFQKTYQQLNDKVYSGAVVGAGIGGDFKIGIGVKHGWVAIGSTKKVTKSEGNVVHELDGRPAITIYEDYFGEEEASALKKETLAKLAITYPLGMKITGSEEMLVRAPLSVNDAGSITCAAEVPEGSDIQLMIGSKEEAIRVANEAAVNAMAQLGGSTPKAAIIFNCIARNKIFAERSGEEISAIQAAIGVTTPLIGFYTYGEQAPLGGEVKNIEQCNTAFHNETVVIFLIAE